jgi:hypothetical protein
MGVATTAAADSIAALTTGIRVIIGIDMEARPIGMMVRGMPTVHEVAPPTGMTGPEVQPDGEEARPTGAAVPEVRPDGAAAPRLGAAVPARFTGPVVAPVRGGVELSWTCEKAGSARKL